MNYIPETKKVKHLKLDEQVYLSDDILGMIDCMKTVRLSVENNGEYTEPQSISPLSVVTTSKDAYMNISQTESFLSDALYLVETDNLDACGNKIVNVARPVEYTDAANKKYVDDIMTFNQSNMINPICFAPSKYVQGTQFDNCNNIGWTEFILSETFGEIVGSDVADANGNVYISMLKLRTRDDFRGAESNTVNAQIVENPGTSTDITQFIDVEHGTSMNSVKCEPSRMMTFYFDNVKLNINKRYAIKFINSAGVLKNVHLTLIADTKLKSKINGGNVINFIAIMTMVGASNLNNATRSLLMPDLNTNDLYAVYIQNGKLVSQKL